MLAASVISSASRSKATHSTPCGTLKVSSRPSWPWAPVTRTRSISAVDAVRAQPGVQVIEDGQTLRLIEYLVIETRVDCQGDIAAAHTVGKMPRTIHGGHDVGIAMHDQQRQADGGPSAHDILHGAEQLGHQTRTELATVHQRVGTVIRNYLRVAADA